jgi:hypothetical protein
VSTERHSKHVTFPQQRQDSKIQIEGPCEGQLEFRRYGTRVVTKGMADFSAIKEHFNSQNLNYFTFFPKSLKPMKAVIRHLPGNTHAEEIYGGLVELGFDIISVKQMSTIRRSQGSESINIPLFHITIPRSEKSHEIFKLTSLCYILIKVEPCRSQNGLTQCHNCQQFGHVWANCKQPPVVWRRPSPQGMPRKGQGRFNTVLLQL